MDKATREFIEIRPDILTKLIEKTLAFLHNIAQPSSSITQDIKILMYMAKNVTKLLPREYTVPDQSLAYTNGHSHHQSGR